MDPGESAQMKVQDEDERLSDCVTLCGFASHIVATRTDWVPGQAPAGPVLHSIILQSLPKCDYVFQAHLASLPTFSLLTHCAASEQMLQQLHGWKICVKLWLSH